MYRGNCSLFARTHEHTISILLNSRGQKHIWLRHQSAPNGWRLQQGDVTRAKKNDKGCVCVPTPTSSPLPSPTQRCVGSPPSSFACSRTQISATSDFWAKHAHNMSRLESCGRSHRRGPAISQLTERMAAGPDRGEGGWGRRVPWEHVYDVLWGFRWKGGWMASWLKSAHEKHFHLNVEVNVSEDKTEQPSMN